MALRHVDDLTDEVIRDYQGPVTLALHLPGDDPITVELDLTERSQQVLHEEVLGKYLTAGRPVLGSRTRPEAPAAATAPVPEPEPEPVPDVAPPAAAPPRRIGVAPPRTPPEPSDRQIRAWALKAGYDLKATQQIPTGIRTAYLAHLEFDRLNR